VPRVLIVPNIGNDAALDAARELAAWLAEAGHDAVLAADDAQAAWLESNGVPPNEIGAPDLVVALGGDGTILKAVHLLAGAGSPILGVNLGRLGFLSGDDGAHVTDAVADALAGRGRTEQRLTLEISLTIGGRASGIHHAFNEAFVGRAVGARAVEIDVAVNGSFLSRVVCDGVVVSTATGSTAYAMSAGGPILAPDVAGMVVVAVSPHTLATRAVVAGPNDRVALTFPDPARASACVVVDGDLVPCRSQLERVEIAVGPHVVTLVRLGDRDFYAAVRETFLAGP
jgi:NAD+ kinase